MIGFMLPKLTRTETAHRMLMSRAKRLVRLVECSAPEQIIAREARMVYEASLLLDPELIKESFNHVTHRARQLAGFCIEAKCEERIAEGSIFSSCEKHTKEAEEYCKESDAEEPYDFSS